MQSNVFPRISCVRAGTQEGWSSTAVKGQHIPMATPNFEQSISRIQFPPLCSATTLSLFSFAPSLHADSSVLSRPLFSILGTVKFSLVCSAENHELLVSTFLLPPYLPPQVSLIVLLLIYLLHNSLLCSLSLFLLVIKHSSFDNCMISLSV